MRPRRQRESVTNLFSESGHGKRRYLSKPDNGGRSSDFPIKETTTQRQQNDNGDAIPNRDNDGHARELRHEDYTVGWIATLWIEWEVAQSMLDEVHKTLPRREDDTKTYAFGRIADHNVVIACLPDGYKRRDLSAVNADSMWETFPSIRRFLLVGIGSGVPDSSDIRLGDIVVGLEAVAFDADISSSRVQGVQDPVKPTVNLLTAIAKLRASHTLVSSRVPEITSQIAQQAPSMIKYSHPGLEDQLFRGTYLHAFSRSICEGCDRSELVERASRPNTSPKIHYGRIASFDSVIKDATLRSDISSKLDALCLDLAGARIVESAPGLVIRGISDYADSHKNNQWQEYAAAGAAAYAKQLLSGIPADSTPILQDTTRWFLDSSEYQLWRAGSGNILFCPGLPGSGKSHIATTVITDLQRAGIAYIYFDHKPSPRQATSGIMLSSLIDQLCLQRSSLQDSSQDVALRRTEGIDPSPEEFYDALTATTSRLCIVIDGLDQCGRFTEGLSHALDTLLSSTAMERSSVMVTSRFVPEITNRFRTFPYLEVSSPESGIGTYLDYELSGSHFSHVSDEVKGDVREYIIEESKGQFIFAKTYCESLARISRTRSVSGGMLKNSISFQSIELICKSMMHHIEERRPESILAKQTVLWLSLAKRALTLPELQHAISTDRAHLNGETVTLSPEENLPQIEDIVSSCRGLVMADDDDGPTLRFFHPAVYECYRRHPRAEAIGSIICVVYLSLPDFNEDFCYNDAYRKEVLKSYPLYDYAARHWGDHARKASQTTKEIMEFLKDDYMVEQSVQVLFAGERRVPKQVTGLHLAAHFGLHDAVEALLNDGGAQLQVKDSNGETPAWWAARAGQDAIVKLLSKLDTITLNLIINYGDLQLASRLIQSEYNINATDYRKRTPLHNAVANGHQELVKDVLSAGPNLESEDINGKTPLRLALLTGADVIISDLLRMGASTLEIEASYWRNCYSVEPHDYIWLGKDGVGGLSIRSAASHDAGLNPTDLTATEKQRSMLQYSCTTNMKLFPMWDTTQLNSLWRSNHLCVLTKMVVEQQWIYHISISVPVDPHKTSDDRLAIEWNARWCSEDNEELWRTISHRSNLPLLWLPPNGAHFFRRFILELEKKLASLCDSYQDHLSSTRKMILEKEGRDPRLLQSLLQDGQALVDLRRDLIDLVSTAKGFSGVYCKRHDEAEALDELLGTIDQLLYVTSKKVDKIEETAKDLIQMEFNLASIVEARSSTNTSVSMARLSWITFVFLPLTFISGLFGMNVDVLADNPPWWLYIPFAAGVFAITTTVWTVLRKSRRLEKHQRKQLARAPTFGTSKMRASKTQWLKALVDFKPRTPQTEALNAA